MARHSQHGTKHRQAHLLQLISMSLLFHILGPKCDLDYKTLLVNYIYELQGCIDFISTILISLPFWHKEYQRTLHFFHQISNCGMDM